MGNEILFILILVLGTVVVSLSLDFLYSIWKRTQEDIRLISKSDERKEK